MGCLIYFSSIIFSPLQSSTNHHILTISIDKYKIELYDKTLYKWIIYCIYYILHKYSWWGEAISTTKTLFLTFWLCHWRIRMFPAYTYPCQPPPPQSIVCFPLELDNFHPNKKSKDIKQKYQWKSKNVQWFH